MGEAKQLKKGQHREILNALSARVERFIERKGEFSDRWRANLQELSPVILDSDTAEEFERNVTLLLRSLDVSHIGFYREDLERCSAKMALCATYMEAATDGQKRWVFQDVHRGGPADLGSIWPGDVLLGVGSTRSIPPDHPVFKMGSELGIILEGKNGQVVSKTVRIPRPKRKNQLPFVEPEKVVYGRKISSDVGCLAISMFPGSIGIDVANEIESELQGLGAPRRLVIDLRGNSGGGLGFLRLINLIETDVVRIGTFQRYCSTVDDVEPYFAIDEVPRNRKELVGLALRYSLQMASSRLQKRALSVQLRTRPIGSLSCRGRIVILTNRHTASASEMLVAHVCGRRLAVLVGESTVGRVVGGGKARLPYGYWVVLPAGSYRTFSGAALEGTPIDPDIHVPFEPVSARGGEDRQMEKALEVVQAL